MSEDLQMLKPNEFFGLIGMTEQLAPSTSEFPVKSKTPRDP
jgi:hypothetical protein